MVSGPCQVAVAFSFVFVFRPEFDFAFTSQRIHFQSDQGLKVWEFNQNWASEARQGLRE